MLIEHDGARPRIDPAAYVAPNAVISGDVIIGPDSRVMFGAVVTADGGPVVVGARCVVMETAVIRGSRRHPVAVGDDVLIGPRVYLSGCTVEDRCFLATGATVFNGARIGAGAQVRINGVVHIRTALPPDSIVPIGWVAVGDPATILPPDRHDEIWAIQKRLDFPREVFGLKRLAGADSLGAIMPEMMRRYAGALGSHEEDRTIEED